MAIFSILSLMNGDNLAQISHQIAAISILKAVPSLQLLSWALAVWFSVLSTWHSPSYCWFGWLMASGGCCQATALWPPLWATMNSLLVPLCCTWAWKQERISRPRRDPRVRQSAQSGLTLFQPPELLKHKQVSALLLPKAVTHQWHSCPAGRLADVEGSAPWHSTAVLAWASGCKPSRCGMQRGWKNKSCCPQK